MRTGVNRYIRPGHYFAVRATYIRKNLSGTASYDSGTGLLTVTMTAHGMTVGQTFWAAHNVTSAGGLATTWRSTFYPCTVVDANTYTCQLATGGTFSGTPALYGFFSETTGLTLSSHASAYNVNSTFAAPFASTPATAGGTFGTVNTTSAVLQPPSTGGSGTLYYYIGGV